MEMINLFERCKLLVLERDKMQYLAFALKAYTMSQKGIDHDSISKKLGFDLYRNIENVIYDGELIANNDFCIADIIIGTTVGERVINGKWKKVYMYDLIDVFDLDDINAILESDGRKKIQILNTYPQLVCDYTKIKRLYEYKGPTSCESFRNWLLRENNLNSNKTKSYIPKKKKEKKTEIKVAQPPVVKQEVCVKRKPEREDPLSCLYMYSSYVRGLMDKPQLQEMYNISMDDLNASMRYGRLMFNESKNLEILCGSYIADTLKKIDIRSVSEIRSTGFSKSSFRKILVALSRSYDHGIDILLDYTYDHNGKGDIQNIIEYLIKTSDEYKEYVERYNDLYYKFHSNRKSNIILNEILNFEEI